MNFNTHIPETHLRNPLTRLDHRTDLFDIGVDVQSPNVEPKRYGAVQKLIICHIIIN